ncbi:MAG: arginine--tRNA ligase, partial [archaeon]
KEFRKSPADIAAEINSKLKLPKSFSRSELRGPYINFFVEENALAQTALSETKAGKKSVKGKKIIVEYCQANPLKDFHIGHVRNICLGESIARLLEAQGKKVLRVDYCGDVGPHASKSLYAYRNLWKGAEPKSIAEQGKWLGKLYAMGAKEVKGNPELEEKMREMVVQLEKGDKKLVSDWKKLRKMSLTYFDYIYKELGIKFDRIILESEVEKEGIKIVNRLYMEGIAVKDDGALLVDLTKYNLDKFLVLKSDGAALYSSKDIALAKMKKQKLKAELSYNVVGSEQKFYFQQLIKTLELLNQRKSEYCETIHVPYELVMLEEGKMASREGNVITYIELFEKVFQKTLAETRQRHEDWSQKKVAETAKAIALAAIKFGMLSQDKNKTIIFNWDKATSIEGETGPFVMYSYARAQSILKKAGKFAAPKKPEFKEEKEKELLSVISKYSEKAAEAEAQMSPHKIAHYLLELASTFNSFYHEVPVLKAGKGGRESRLLLVKVAAETIRKGMELLNIQATQEM